MTENMDDGEIELSDHNLLPISNSWINNQQSLSVDPFLDDLLRNSQTCTHTHTCNPPGPDDSTHTHTCYHTHTCVVPSDEDNVPNDNHSPGSKYRRPSGNREAVRKYREKKKAHVAYLEEEVKKLRFLNQQLMRKLQRQAILENEVLRLRGILVDLRGKIDNELGDFPFGKKCGTISSFKEGECVVQPTNVNDLGCRKMIDAWDGRCQPEIVDCQAKTNFIESGENRIHNSRQSLVSSALQEGK
ncbi:hypothetical protein BUALT_Bualt19G0044900 [Buddleja alternifolia]|uniref:BZIP domain-containing protein n=1 Tax=Buddleja alternifolia TaxID=168488 RepID=A0AAV6W9C9_9LAMI|nr:hypothetical protein BUALT_Bualt19G0044900 [Buddleja alternifolia]